MVQNRTITKFRNIELTDISISSHQPNTIYASVKIDGELSLSADLEMCFERIRQTVEEVRKEVNEAG
jgi:hypothetical protein